MSTGTKVYNHKLLKRFQTNMYSKLCYFYLTIYQNAFVGQARSGHITHRFKQ